MKKLSMLWLLFFILFNSVFAGCGTASFSSPGVFEPDDILAMLSNPGKAVDGTVALLSNLGIGVYTPEGKKVKAGSENTEHDFIVYDFQIPMLIRSFNTPARPLSDLAEMLAHAGIDLNEDELKALYRRVYADNEDAYIVRFLHASGLNVSDISETTGLQEWLLLLDTLIKPNLTVSNAAKATIPLTGSALTAAAGFYNAPIISGWGYVFNAVDYAHIINAEIAFCIINSALYRSMLDVELIITPESVHEGHGGPGETAELSLRVVSSFQPVSVPVQSGYMVMFPGMPGMNGPIMGAEVQWDLSQYVLSRGTVSAGGVAMLPGVRMVTDTDSEGRSKLVFQARQEPSNGEGDLQSIDAPVSVRVDVGRALRDFYGVSSLFSAYIPPLYLFSSLQIEWHEEDNLCANTKLINEGEGYKVVAEGWNCSGELEGEWQWKYDLDVFGYGVISGNGTSIFLAKPDEGLWLSNPSSYTIHGILEADDVTIDVSYIFEDVIVEIITLENGPPLMTNHSGKGTAVVKVVAPEFSFVLSQTYFNVTSEVPQLITFQAHSECQKTRSP